MGMLEKALAGAMNTKIIGSGETTLVLAHGYGGDQSVWDDVLPGLTRRHRVVVFDWNFSGAVSTLIFDSVKYSSYEAFSDDLISLLDEMNLKGIVYVGHSMAGMIGCIASVKRPDLFQRLVLLGASPRYLNSEGYEGGFERAEVEKIFSNIESDFQAWAQGFSRLVVGAHDPVSVERFHRCLQRMRPQTALSLAKTVFLCDERDVLERVQVPCTIIQTTNDVVVPMSVAYYMQSKIVRAKASLEIMASDGHFPQLITDSSGVVVLLEVLDRVLLLQGLDLSDKHMVENRSSVSACRSNLSVKY